MSDHTPGRTLMGIRQEAGRESPVEFADTNLTATTGSVRSPLIPAVAVAVPSAELDQQHPDSLREEEEMHRRLPAPYDEDEGDLKSGALSPLVKVIHGCNKYH